MTVAEIIGYLGAVIVVCTYSMKTMVPLRICGITSNLILITYGYFGGAYPTLVLHLILLPLNIHRLHEMLQLIRRVKEATAGDQSMDWLKPFMTRRPIKAGELLFEKGEAADEMFFVVSGKLRLRQIGLDVLPGAVVGEMGLLTPNRTRTQTLECIEDGLVLRIAYDKIEQLYFQNPRFGFYLLRLTTARLFENIAKLETKLAERERPFGAGESALQPS
jgi:hypothetical protein